MTKILRGEKRHKTFRMPTDDVTLLQYDFYIQNLNSYKHIVKGTADNGYFVLSSTINNRIMMTLFHIYCSSSISISNLSSIRFEDRAKVLSESDTIVGTITERTMPSEQLGAPDFEGL